MTMTAHRKGGSMVFLMFNTSTVGPGSSIGIATGYGLYGAGIESREGEIFHVCPDRPWGPPSLLYNGYWVFPRCKATRVWC
jgi:hypothetical protein